LVGILTICNHLLAGVWFCHGVCFITFILSLLFLCAMLDGSSHPICFMQWMENLLIGTLSHTGYSVYILNYADIISAI